MSGVVRMTPVEAEDLLGYVRQSIARASTDSAGESAPHFVMAPGEPPQGLTESERLQAACAGIRSQLAAFGTLPPSPPTVRGRLGLSIVKVANRLFWWPIEVSRRFANATSDYARLQVEHQEQQRRALIAIEKRLHVVETMLLRSAAERGGGEQS